METEKQIEYWLKASNLDLQTALDLFNSGKNLHFCLFMCHLSIEKLLKALVVKASNDFPPKSHNLLRLAEIANITLKDNKVEFLEELNQFQLSTRYPDEKFTIYTLATKEFTEDKLIRVKELHKWLISMI